MSSARELLGLASASRILTCFGHDLNPCVPINILPTTLTDQLEPLERRWAAGWEALGLGLAPRRVYGGESHDGEELTGYSSRDTHQYLHVLS